MRDGVIFATDEPLIRADELQLLGAHNVENAMAAATAALASGLPRDAVAEGLRTFQGVPHRLERVRELDGVLYVNDSKATNVASAVAGIRAFEGGVRLIAGGRPKQESFTPLAEAVGSAASVGDGERRWRPSSARPASIVQAGTPRALRQLPPTLPGQVVLLAGVRQLRRLHFEALLPRVGGGPT
jgi:UDP-N-acetylmuramoylalanine--D-glutamate ligase